MIRCKCVPCYITVSAIINILFFLGLVTTVALPSVCTGASPLRDADVDVHARPEFPCAIRVHSGQAGERRRARGPGGRGSSASSRVLRTRIRRTRFRSTATAERVHLSARSCLGALLPRSFMKDHNHRPPTLALLHDWLGAGVPQVHQSGSCGDAAARRRAHGAPPVEQRSRAGAHSFRDDARLPGMAVGRARRRRSAPRTAPSLPAARAHVLRSNLRVTFVSCRGA